MKKILVLSLFLAALSTLAQDVIVLKDGSTIISKVYEVNKSEIKYKKHSNLNGPQYTIRIKDVMSINYENGESKYLPQESNTEISEAEYILNTNSKKFHRKDCGLSKDIKEHNKATSNKSRDELINSGYSPCKNCNP